MVQYILEAITFQLVFLIMYDFFLKKETFFQWNRLYLIGTYLLSLLLPWVKLEIISTAIPENLSRYPEYLRGLSGQEGIAAATGNMGIWHWAPAYIVGGGMLLSLLLFGYKLYKILQLRQMGAIQHFPDFTMIIIENSALAFSFFRSIFLGDKIREKDYQGIIEHEMVHIKQRHTLDLLFFEGMRIIGWFNPLVYCYQHRLSELHEYIADAKVSKTGEKEQCQLLLSQVFQTESISFVNHYFKSSLTKKRILMLQKARSKKVWKLKYLLLIPIISAMLIYSSCQKDFVNQMDQVISVNDIENLSEAEENAIVSKLVSLSEGQDLWKLTIEDKNSIVSFTKADEGSYISGPNNLKIKARMQIDSKIHD